MTPDPRGYSKDCPTRHLEDLAASKRQERWEYKTKRFKGERGTALEIQIMKGVYKEVELILEDLARRYNS
jgi:hypothetical protein